MPQLKKLSSKYLTHERAALLINPKYTESSASTLTYPLIRAGKIKSVKPRVIVVCPETGDQYEGGEVKLSKSLICRASVEKYIADRKASAHKGNQVKATIVNEKEAPFSAFDNGEKTKIFPSNAAVTRALNMSSTLLRKIILEPRSPGDQIFKGIKLEAL